MRRAAIILLLALPLGGCNNFRHLLGDEKKDDTAARGQTWVPVSGSWSGGYTTNQANKVTAGQPCGSSMDLMQFSGQNSFWGDMRDGCIGYNGGDITGTVNPADWTFKMHVTHAGSFCPGAWDLAGTIIRGPNGGGAQGFKFTSVSGSDCLGSYTTITGGY